MLRKVNAKKNGGKQKPVRLGSTMRGEEGEGV